MKSRILIAGIVLSFFYSAFLARGVWLQFFPNERLTSAKKKNFEKIITLNPRRGIIYDRKGRELAITIASQSLFADPFLISEPKKTARKLSSLLKIPYKKIHTKIKNKSRRFVWIKRHIAENKSQKILSWNIKGLAFLEEPKRIYPNGSLLAQTIGFTGRDGKGLEGLELQYNSVLQGEEKKVLVRKDAMGRPLFSDINTNLIAFPSNGADIYLTIDSDLQFYFEKELKKVVHKYSAKSGLGIILNPQNGHILAMAHTPSFDLNKPYKVDPALFRNRCIIDAFEPGSTLKPFIIAGALKKGLPPTTSYSGMDGQLSIEGHIIKEAESSHKFTDITLREILSYSSNIGAAQTALNLGDSFLYQVLSNFGFGRKLPLNFPGEGSGILHKPPWKKLQLATIGFGHAVSVTPLQMASAYSAIANKGIIMKPTLVSAISYKETNRKKSFTPEVWKAPLTPKTAETLTVMLISAVSEGGTGWKAQVKGFLSAGKTGTAQVVDKQKGGYLKGQYISSFAGFIPAHDPKFVIYIAIEQPQEKFYGSTVAAPVFSSIAEYAVRQAGIAPVLISEKNILQKTKKTSTEKSKMDRAIASEEGKTPDFIGLSLRGAYQKAKREQVTIRIKSGSGLVIKTIPEPFSPLPNHRKIKLILNPQKKSL